VIVFRLVIALALLYAGCGASAARGPSTPAPLPQLDVARPVLAAFGQRLYRALAQGRPQDVAFDDAALGRLLLPHADLRALALRAQMPGPRRLPSEQRQVWAGARYAEICVQQGRAEPRGGALGLRAPGFVFERALVVGREPGGGALAGWVEGEFLHTDAGFGALSLERVEVPRRDHADLELAVCELRAGAGDHKNW
jgi:hypothetical protein